MSVVYQRRNRKTKGIVELHHERDLRGLALWMDLYWCQCQHGKKHCGWICIGVNVSMVRRVGLRLVKAMRSLAWRIQMNGVKSA
jgi:hypothetical protein